MYAPARFGAASPEWKFTVTLDATGSERTDHGEQLSALISRLDAVALEAVGETDVGVQSRRILVEVEERIGPLDQSRNLAQLDEERLQRVERL